MNRRAEFLNVLDGPMLAAAFFAARFTENALVRQLARRWRWARWKVRLRRLGRESEVYPTVVIHYPEHVSIGARCAIADFVQMWGAGGIYIGDNVLIAAHAVITSQTHDTNASIFRDSHITAPCILEDNVWIGAGAVILPGVRIGTGSVIGAGSVVTRSIASGSVAVGVPARVIRHIARQQGNVTTVNWDRRPAYPSAASGDTVE